MASFATPAEMLERLGGAAINEARAQAFLDDASALIRNTAGQTISQVDGAQVEYAGADYLEELQLPEIPVRAVSQVLIDGDLFTDYIWDRIEATVEKTEGYWDTGPIIVTYDHGWEDDSDEIENVKRLCIQLAIGAYTNERAGFETFNEAGIPEQVGRAPTMYLSLQDKMRLYNLRPVMAR